MVSENQAIPNPTRYSNTVRFTILRIAEPLASKLYFLREINVEMPMINIKNGNTRSVGVSPFHCACPSGAYTLLQEPGLFTIIIPAMVIPRRMSRARIRDCPPELPPNPLKGGFIVVLFINNAINKIVLLSLLYISVNS